MLSFHLGRTQNHHQQILWTMSFQAKQFSYGQVLINKVGICYLILDALYLLLNYYLILDAWYFIFATFLPKTCYLLLDTLYLLLTTWHFSICLYLYFEEWKWMKRGEKLPMKMIEGNVRPVLVNYAKMRLKISIDLLL